MAVLLQLGRLWRTVRHLKFVQIYYRIWFKIFKPRIRMSPVKKSKNFKGQITFSARKRQSIVAQFDWVLLNEEGKLDEVGWQDDTRSKLWRYNQHYFDDLNAFNSSDRLKWHQSLIDVWIRDNPPVEGVGWEPYPTSLRIVNWVKWVTAYGSLSVQAEESLVLQARWLAGRLEWHLLGNHLFVNAKALIFAGIYFDSLEANRWLNLGFNILAKQVPEQILSDGAQFELSPMYHALAIEDFLDLINICEINAHRISSNHRLKINEWRQLVSKMLHWLGCMSHPDNKISFFNDAAFGIAPSNTELFDYAERLGILKNEPAVGLTHLKESGYVRLQTTNAVLIADLASIGPDYLPGHAHADTLSFELSIFGKRIFVNSGTSEYGAGAERQRQRGTLAHNTVCVEQKDSSEVWSGFRVGSRAKVTDKFVVSNGSDMYISGAHDGYKRINADLIHSRSFKLKENTLKIKDNLSLPFNAEVRYYCHPDLLIRKDGNSSGFITTDDGLMLRWYFVGAYRVEIIECTWHPEFGKLVPSKCLIAHFKNENCEFNLDWN